MRLLGQSTELFEYGLVYGFPQIVYFFLVSYRSHCCNNYNEHYQNVKGFV